MKQSRKAAMLESILNQVVGTVLVAITQKLYFLFNDIDISATKHVGLIAICMLLSMVKHYSIRRYFSKSSQSI